MFEHTRIQISSSNPSHTTDQITVNKEVGSLEGARLVRNRLSAAIVRAREGVDLAT